jgi:predicted ester cyclase
MTPEEIDAVLDRQTRAHLAHDLDAVLTLYARDAVHEFIGLPGGIIRGLPSIRQRCELMYRSMSDEEYRTIHRAYGTDFVADELMVSATFTGTPWGLPGEGRQVSVRFLHTCEFRDGLILKETSWVDAAALVGQLLTTPEP